MKKLPKTVYVRWTDAGDGELYLQTDESAEDHAETGEKHRVGVYRLVDTVEVSAPRTVRVVKTRS